MTFRTGIVGLKAVGTLTAQDYQQVVEPLLEEIRRDGKNVRLLYQFAPEFVGFTPGGVWEDAKIGLRAMRLLDGCAVLTDLPWIRKSVSLVSYLMPCPVRVFENRYLDQALAWLVTLPGPSAAQPRMIPQAGVIVVELEQALQTRDFDEIAMLADPYIEAHGKLEGLVVHARQFPGWENLGSVMSHIRFVRDHHRNVRKVALSVDGNLAKFAPRIAEHFVKAEIRVFGHDELDAAIAWASGSRADAARPIARTRLARWQDAVVRPAWRQAFARPLRHEREEPSRVVDRDSP